MTVTTPARTTEALATRPGDCPLCTDPIDKGDPIRPTTPPLGWAHASCAADYFDVYPENDPDNDGAADSAPEETRF